MLKLKRIGRSQYQTPDGRYLILKDPHSGNQSSGWGYVSWLIYDNHADPDDSPLFDVHYSTLREAREALEEGAGR